MIILLNIGRLVMDRALGLLRRRRAKAAAVGEAP